MINYDDCIMVDETPCVTYKMIEDNHTPKEVKSFCQFMTGQTCTSVIEDGKEVAGIYWWDYERWIMEGKKNKQGKNWD